MKNVVITHIAASLGLSQAGRILVPVPETGVPAEYLEALALYLATEEEAAECGRPYSGARWHRKYELEVTAPGWDGVLARAEELARAAESAAVKQAAEEAAVLAEAVVASEFLDALEGEDLLAAYDRLSYAVKQALHDTPAAGRVQQAAQARREAARVREAPPPPPPPPRAANVAAIRAVLVSGGCEEHVIARYDAGRLAEETRDKILADVAFAAITLEPYEPLADGDLEHDDDCEEAEPVYRTGDYTGSLTAAEWSAWVAAKAAIEGAGCTAALRLVTLSCRAPSCWAKVLCLQAVAEATIGGVRLRCRYAI
jgi:hypothetical protein